MKNLKKILSVVLVVVMALGMLTIASAAGITKITDYKDAADIKQKEAVDLLTALGIMVGDDNGNFGPQLTFTREQAAKVIVYVSVGKAAADKLAHAPSSFTDVASDRWSNPFIEYCAARGIINGYGDGKFGPANPISASEFAKLLLGAIGYGVNGEFVGANWEINAIVKAQQIGILTLDRDFTKAAAREDVAQYAFNALVPWGNGQTDLVVWSSLLNDYVASTTSYDGKTANGWTLGEKNYFLVAVPDIDGYGFGGHYWVQSIAPTKHLTDFYITDVTLGKVTATSGEPVRKLWTKYDPLYIADLNDVVQIYYNGYTMQSIVVDENGDPVLDENDLPVIIDVTTAALGLSVPPTGVIFNLVDSNRDGKADKIIIIEKAVYQITGTPAVGTDSKVSIPGVTEDPIIKDLVTYPADLKKGDIVLGHYNNQKELIVEKAKSVEGKMTAFSKIAGIIPLATFEGGFYTPSGLESIVDNTDNSLYAFCTGTLNLNKAARFWLDDNNSVVWAELTEAVVPATYGVVVGYYFNDEDPVAGAYAKARVVLEDGTVGVYNVAPDKVAKVVVDQTTALALDVDKTGALVQYKIANEMITLIPLDTDKDGVTDGSVGADYAGGVSTIYDGTAKLLLTTTTKVFFLNTEKTWNAVTNPVSILTGYANTGKVKEDTALQYVLALDANGNATNRVVAVLIGAAGSYTGSKEYLFVVSNSPTLGMNDKDQETYTYGGYDGTTYKTITLLNPIESAFEEALEDEEFVAPEGLYSYVVGADTYATAVAYEATNIASDIETNDDGDDYYTNSVTFVDATQFELANYGDSEDFAVQTNSATKVYKISFPSASLPVGSSQVGELSPSNNKTFYLVAAYIQAPNAPASVVYYYTTTTPPVAD